MPVSTAYHGASVTAPVPRRRPSDKLLPLPPSAGGLARAGCLASQPRAGSTQGHLCATARGAAPPPPDAASQRRLHSERAGSDVPPSPPAPRAADSARRGPRHPEPPHRTQHRVRPRCGGERPPGRDAGRGRRAHTYRLPGSGRHGDGEQRPGPARLGGCRLPGGLPPPLGQPVPHIPGESPPSRAAQLPPPPPHRRRSGPAAGPQPPHRLRTGRGAQAAAPPQEAAQGSHTRRSAPATGGRSPPGCRQKPREKRGRGGEARGPCSPRPTPPAPLRRRGRRCGRSDALHPAYPRSQRRGWRHRLPRWLRQAVPEGRPWAGRDSRGRQRDVLCPQRAATELAEIRTWRTGTGPNPGS